MENLGTKLRHLADLVDSNADLNECIQHIQESVSDEGRYLLIKVDGGREENFYSVVLGSADNSPFSFNAESGDLSDSLRTVVEQLKSEQKT